MDRNLIIVLDEIQSARKELSMYQQDTLACEKNVENATKVLVAASAKRDEAILRLDALELKLRATMAGDTTTVITVPPPRQAEPEEIGRAG